MNRLFSLFLLPAIALAATYSGTVVDLAGTPLPGISIKTITDSTTSSAGGTWTLAGVNSVRPRTVKTVSVTSHLIWDGGRPRLVFAGADGSGRAMHLGPTSPSGGAGARAMDIKTGALNVFWKGKRFVVLPVPRLDSNGIVFRIDTAWKDDARIPWNPRINYGSLLDSRDGQTYRTVAIGSQTWMAQNLALTDAKGYLGSCWGQGFAGTSPELQNCATYGRLYDWKSVADNDSLENGRIRGICPFGWHVSSIAEWDSLVSGLHTLSQPAALKSVSGWSYSSGNGIDTLGLRILPAGYKPVFTGTSNWLGLGSMTGIWEAETGSHGYQYSRVISVDAAVLQPSETEDPTSLYFSVRCLKDAR